jgi:glycosyltransferase involved in cell wall biosynthesis
MTIKKSEQTKKQVVFFTWSLWGGGQEKLLLYLAKHINPAYFEPHIVYSNQPENRPVEPELSITTHCLMNSTAPSSANTSGQQNRHGFQSMLSRIFHRLPTSVKDKLRSYRNRIFSKFFNLLNPVPQLISADQKLLHTSGMISKSIVVSLNYAFALRKVLSQLSSSAIIVAMQEGPTIQAWLNKIHDTHNYISYLCIPESIYLPFLYRDPEQLQVEKWLFTNACRAAKTIIVPNDWMRTDIEKEFGIDHKSIRIIPNAIDCQQVLNMSAMPMSGHINLSGKTVFVQLARLDFQKNHELMVEACDILRNKLNDFLILVIGDGTERVKIEKMVYERNLSNYIKFLGDMKNPYPYLKIARASILTSRFEASPLALLDSLLLGAVPVSVDCITGPRDILDHGKYGILVPPNDPNAFAEAIYCIATDDQLHDKLKSQGMPRAFEFDISNFVKQWEEVLCSGNNSETHS